MSDLRIVNVPFLEGCGFDLNSLKNGVIDETQELATAVIIALATDARAHDDDILPGLDDTDRRGWWGDCDAAEIWNGWPIGSRLWLLRRAKITKAGAAEGSLKARIEMYIHEALQPFITAGIVTKIDVTATQTSNSAFAADVVLWRNNNAILKLAFGSIWKEISDGSANTYTQATS